MTPTLKGIESRHRCPDCGKRLLMFVRNNGCVYICSRCDIDVYTTRKQMPEPDPSIYDKDWFLLLLIVGVIFGAILAVIGGHGG